MPKPQPFGAQLCFNSEHSFSHSKNIKLYSLNVVFDINFKPLIEIINLEGS